MQLLLFAPMVTWDQHWENWLLPSAIFTAFLTSEPEKLSDMINDFSVCIYVLQQFLMLTEWRFSFGCVEWCNWDCGWDYQKETENMEMI